MMESDIVALWGKVVSCQRVVVYKPWNRKKMGMISMITLFEQNAAQLTENIFLAKFFDLATYLGVQLCSSWKKKMSMIPLLEHS